MNEQKSAALNRGLGIGSLTTGILSLVFFIKSWYISLPCAFFAIVLGAVTRKRGSKSSLSTAGILLGSITLGVMLILIAIFAGFLSQFLK